MMELFTNDCLHKKMSFVIIKLTVGHNYLSQ